MEGWGWDFYGLGCGVSWGRLLRSLQCSGQFAPPSAMFRVCNTSQHFHAGAVGWGLVMYTCRNLSFASSTRKHSWGVHSARPEIVSTAAAASLA